MFPYLTRYPCTVNDGRSPPFPVSSAGNRGVGSSRGMTFVSPKVEASIVEVKSLMVDPALNKPPVPKFTIKSWWFTT